MKHGVTTYSFCSYLDDGRMDLYGAVREAAKMGFEGVELANLTQNYAYDPARLAATAQEAGVELCGWATSANFVGDIAAQVDFLRREMDRAAGFGCKVFRTDVYHDERVPDPYAPKVLDVLRNLAGEAAARSMALVTENHGGYLITPERLDRLVRGVGHANFGLLCDFANFAAADVDPALAVRELRGAIRHVHMKDCHLLDGDRLFPGSGWYLTNAGNYWRCAISGQGNLPLYRCLKSLADAGYDGYLIQEFEGIEDCLYALRAGLNYTKRLLAALKDGMWSDDYIVREA